MQCAACSTRSTSRKKPLLSGRQKWLYWCERWDSNPHGETTRTSNVLVYHSNTLASAPKYYNLPHAVCQLLFAVFSQSFHISNSMHIYLIVTVIRPRFLDFIPYFGYNIVTFKEGVRVAMARFRLITFTILIYTALAFAGCSSFGSSGQAEPAASAALQSDPAALYRQAAEQIDSADQLSLYIGTIKDTVYEGQTFTRSTQQDLNLQHIGSTKLRGSMEETLRIGTYCVSIAELYEKENGYIVVDGNTFVSPLSADDYCARYAPAVCFDTALYSDIQSAARGSYTCISFSQASAAENWALPAGGTFKDAFGYAVLDDENGLLESTYTLSYTVGGATVTQTTKVVVRSTDSCDIQSPDTSGAQTSIEYLDALRMLEQACGYLLQAENIQSTATSNIDCQAFAINRTETAALDMSGTGNDLVAALDMKIDQLNQSRGGEITEITQAEAFKDGTYSVTSNGTTTTNDTISASAMKTYCQDILIRDILLPEHIAGAEMTESEAGYTITFFGSDLLAEAICAKISNTLYSDPELLHTLSSDYHTELLQCVLTVDKHTGLPLSFSSAYKANHTIEAITYGLESNTEQSYAYKKTSG